MSAIDRIQIAYDHMSDRRNCHPYLSKGSNVYTSREECLMALMNSISKDFHLLGTIPESSTEACNPAQNTLDILIQSVGCYNAINANRENNPTY